MAQYVQATTQQNDQLFAKCGTRDIANASSNVSAVAGEHFSIVHESNFSIVQPHDQSGNRANSAAFQHQVVIVVPDYEPTQSMVLNVLNERKTIQTLTLNATRRNGGVDKLVGQYVAENGLLASYSRNNATTDGLGSITLTFVFEKIRHEDKLTQTSGYLQTTA